MQLRPRDGGIQMPEGRDVFIQACTYMPKNAVYLLEKNGFALDDLTYFIGHQANMRIMSNIAKQLNLPEEKFLHNIEELGNTGSVSSALVYAQNDHTLDVYKRQALASSNVIRRLNPDVKLSFRPRHSVIVRPAWQKF